MTMRLASHPPSEPGIFRGKAASPWRPTFTLALHSRHSETIFWAPGGRVCGAPQVASGTSFAFDVTPPLFESSSSIRPTTGLSSLFAPRSFRTLPRFKSFCSTQQHGRWSASSLGHAERLSVVVALTAEVRLVTRERVVERGQVPDDLSERPQVLAGPRRQSRAKGQTPPGDPMSGDPRAPGLSTKTLQEPGLS